MATKESVEADIKEIEAMISLLEDRKTYLKGILAEHYLENSNDGEGIEFLYDKKDIIDVFKEFWNKQNKNMIDLEA